MTVDDLLNVTVMFLDGLCVAATLEAPQWPGRKQARLLDRFFEANFGPTQPYATQSRRRRPRSK